MSEPAPVAAAAAAPAAAPAAASSSASASAGKKCSVCEGDRTDYSSAQLKKKGQRVCKRCVDLAPATAGLHILSLEKFLAALTPALPLNRKGQASRVTHTLMGAITYAYIHKIRLVSKGAFVKSQCAMLGYVAAGAAPSSAAARSLEDEFAVESDHQWVQLTMDDGTLRILDMTASAFEGGVDGICVPGDASDSWRAAKLATICAGPGGESEPEKATKADYDSLVSRLKETPQSRQTLELLKDAKMLVDKMLATQ